MNPRALPWSILLSRPLFFFNPSPLKPPLSQVKTRFSRTNHQQKKETGCPQITQIYADGRMENNSV